LKNALSEEGNLSTQKSVVGINAAYFHLTMSEMNKEGTPPANMHMGSKTVSDTVDIEKMIEKSGCNDIYGVLEECLGEHDRDWRKCQVEVL
jgi:hypothetical protein